MMQRKVPIRSCVSCRTAGEKSGLVRVVRTPEGGVILDLTGKAAGRGAYVCRSAECLRRAVKERRLTRALKAEISEETMHQLEKAVEQGLEA
jgi:predicted RNA-binding protein YlxR (DUF448 family)